MEALIGTQPSPEGLGIDGDRSEESKCRNMMKRRRTRRRTRRRHCNAARRCLTPAFYKWKEEEEGEARRAWWIREERERLGRKSSWKSVCHLSMGTPV